MSDNFEHPYPHDTDLARKLAILLPKDQWVKYDDTRYSELAFDADGRMCEKVVWTEDKKP